MGNAGSQTDPQGDVLLDPKSLTNTFLKSPPHTTLPQWDPCTHTPNTQNRPKVVEKILRPGQDRLTHCEPWGGGDRPNPHTLKNHPPGQAEFDQPQGKGVSRVPWSAWVGGCYINENRFKRRKARFTNLGFPETYSEL